MKSTVTFSKSFYISITCVFIFFTSLFIFSKTMYKEPATVLMKTYSTNSSISDLGREYLSIGNKRYKIEEATTTEKQALGLGMRDSLPADSVMLFVFPQEEWLIFWMKDMRFAIDIIWLDSSYKVVDIKENATPDSYPQVFVPQQKARYVLEANVGFVKQNSIKIGTILNVNKDLH